MTFSDHFQKYKLTNLSMAHITWTSIAPFHCWRLGLLLLGHIHKRINIFLYSFLFSFFNGMDACVSFSFSSNFNAVEIFLFQARIFGSHSIFCLSSVHHIFYCSITLLQASHAGGQGSKSGRLPEQGIIWFLGNPSNSDKVGDAVASWQFMHQ